MKFTKKDLKIIVNEEIKKLLKEELYKAKSAYQKEPKRWNLEPQYKDAISTLEYLEDKYPVLIGALTKDPGRQSRVRRDACLQELAALQASSLNGRLDLWEKLDAIEKAFMNTFNSYYDAPEEPPTT